MSSLLDMISRNDRGYLPVEIDDGAVLSDPRRERMIDIILFFAHRVQPLPLTRLALLIASLDFEHWLETAKCVTGFDVTVLSPSYSEALSLELEALSGGWAPVDLANAVDVRNGLVFPLRDFNGDHITKRELRIMESLAPENHSLK